MITNTADTDSVQTTNEVTSPARHDLCYCCGGSRQMRRDVPCEVCSGSGLYAR